MRYPVYVSGMTGYHCEPRPKALEAPTLPVPDGFRRLVLAMQSRAILQTATGHALKNHSEVPWLALLLSNCHVRFQAIWPGQCTFLTCHAGWVCQCMGCLRPIKVMLEVWAIAIRTDIGDWMTRICERTSCTRRWKAGSERSILQPAFPIT